MSFAGLRDYAVNPTGQASRIMRSGIIGSASGTRLKNCRPADLPINGMFQPKNLDRKGVVSWPVSF
jgi:hypothetical protein